MPFTPPPLWVVLLFRTNTSFLFLLLFCDMMVQETVCLSPLLLRCPTLHPLKFSPPHAPHPSSEGNAQEEHTTKGEENSMHRLSFTILQSVFCFSQLPGGWPRYDLIFSPSIPVKPIFSPQRTQHDVIIFTSVLFCHPYPILLWIDVSHILTIFVPTLFFYDFVVILDVFPPFIFLLYVTR